MARKGQVTIQETIQSNEEFEDVLHANFDKLICKIYIEFTIHTLNIYNM